MHRQWPGGDMPWAHGIRALWLPRITLPWRTCARGNTLRPKPLAREVLEPDKKMQPEDFHRWLAASVLGGSLAGQKRYGEAEPLLREGYEGMLALKDKIPAADQYYLKLAHQWLVDLEARGKLGSSARISRDDR